MCAVPEEEQLSKAGLTGQYLWMAAVGKGNHQQRSSKNCQDNTSALAKQIT